MLEDIINSGEMNDNGDDDDEAAKAAKAVTAATDSLIIGLVEMANLF